MAENRTPQDSFSSAWPIYLIALLLFFLRFGYGYGFGDQDELIPYLLHLLDPELFENDWFVQLQASGFSIRSYFVWLLVPIAHVIPVWLVVLVTYLALWLAVAHQAYRLSVRFVPDRLAAAGAILAGMGLLHKWTLGSNDLIYSMLVPEMLSWALALASIRLFVDDRVFAAGLLLGIASWFQILVGLQTGLVLCLVALITPGLRIRTVARFLVSFVPASLPVVIPVVVQQIRDAGTADPSLVFYILAPFRNPFHHMFLSFGARNTVRFLVLLVLGVLGFVILSRSASQRSGATVRDGGFLVRFGAIVVVLLVIFGVLTEAIPVLSVAKLQLFKLTTYLKHFAVLLIVGVSITFIPQRVTEAIRSLAYGRALRLVAVGTWLVVLAFGLTIDDYVRARAFPLAHHDSDLGKVERWARDSTRVDALFAVPPSVSSFRSNAHRAIVVNYAAFPFVDDHIVIWFDRLIAIAPIDPPERGSGVKLVLDRAYHSHSEESWNALTLKYGIDYVLLDLRLVEPDLPLERVFSAGDWTVLRTQNTP